MLLDLFVFGYDNFSQKKPGNIFEKAVALRKQLERVLLIDLNNNCKKKSSLISVKFSRKEVSNVHNFTTIKLSYRSNPYLMEMTWQQSFKKTKAKIKSKNIKLSKKCG
ncbi:MAG TPA: hypothetical protein DCF68_04390 [Cyanothece sp. UBA12306]|nr:hypothetical protein [Cyanothece sp. UBA12306]